MVSIDCLSTKVEKKSNGLRQRMSSPASNADGSRLRLKSGTLQRTRLATRRATTIRKNCMSQAQAERFAKEVIVRLFELLYI